MSSAVTPIVELYRYILQPIAPFTWFGLPITTLDVAAATRLCVALRQIRDKLRIDHELARAKSGQAAIVEERSFVRDISATLLVVYGGEAVTCPLLGIPPSFMISGVFPALYTGIQAIVDKLPSVPTPSLTYELPLAFMDSLSRAYLLCNLIPPVILNHSSEIVSTSPWTLLLTSLLTANTGFFFAYSPFSHMPNRSGLTHIMSFPVGCKALPLIRSRLWTQKLLELFVRLC
ncbi:unnamed protein product [Somion occarium]|uniref:Uncharacterized protein n=1 Tax=Somion occarium TaxID=3059160 RepID=A0ABP1D6A4_9APHY